jgi:hypothetical protein
MSFHSSRGALRRLIIACVLVALAGVMIMVTPQASAQEGGDIQYNDPVIVTLNPGENVSRTFAVLPGDTAEIVLSRLAEFTYTAVLIDPNQAATPLLPGADGNTTFLLENAAVGGLYTLVLQASGGTGDLLIQVNSDAVLPVPLPPGSSEITVDMSALRFELVPPEGMAETVLALNAAPDPNADPNAPAGTIPGFSLANADTGEVILTVSGGQLPSIAVTLPAQQTFLLVVEPGEEPQPLAMDWSEEPASDSSSQSSESSDSSDSSQSDSSSSQSTSSCQLVFAGPVNLRSGPGIEYDPPIGQIPAGSTLPVLGHNGDFTWFQLNDNGLIGWAAGDIAATSLQGDCSALPVADFPQPGETSDTLTFTPSYTPGGPTVTNTATATTGPSPTNTSTPTSGPSPTRTYTPTTGPSPTYTATTQGLTNPTATYTPSYTPTTQAQPTATYTPSYTPTTPPAAQVAPEDARFNNPLNIPLDNTASVLDFVSYPGGDREDRVRWDITGMNPNPSLSGGRARLVLAVSCFGQGIENITFFTGGQTFGCGQTIVDREVTADSRTGQVTITAVGGSGTYVQWVLTGTATRVS